MKLERLYSFIIFTLLFFTYLTAQDNSLGTIKGSVIDESSKKPIEFVNVVIHKKTDSTIVTGKVTDKTGIVSFTDIPYGDYFVSFSLIGYKEHKTPSFAIDATHKHLNLGEVKLIATEVSLDEVVIAGEKSLYNASIDRKVYNVDQDLTAKAGSASELLQNVPSVQVDLDGTVSLRGSSNVLIMINGKTSPLMNKSSATALQELPASSIERVEVISNPSAKFKSEGASGIINIVMKKNTTRGLNGNIGGNIGNQDRYNGNVRLNYNPGDLNAFVSYGFRADNRNRINSDDRTLTDSISTVTYYKEGMESDAHPKSHIVSLGVDYEFTDADQFGVSGDYYFTDFGRTELTSKYLYSSSNDLLNHSTRARNNYDKESEYSFKSSLEHKFGKDDHTLKAEYSISKAPETEDNKFTNSYLLPTQPDEFDNTFIDAKEDNSQISLEYSNPLTEESSLEAGYSSEFNKNDIDNHAEYYNPTQLSFVNDGTKSNHFIFDDAIHSFYATYKHSFGEFGLMVGVREEYTLNTSNLVSLDSTIDNSFSNIYPTLHLSYKLTKLTELQLSYSKRTHRPHEDDLNPFPEYRDPRNISAGNPKLLPEYAHSVELGYQYQDESISLLPALFYRYTFNRFTSVTQYLNDTTLLTTRANLSNDQSGGLEVVFSANIQNLFNIHANAFAFINQIDASNIGFSNKSVTTWSSNVTVDMNITESTRLQLNTNYNSSRLTAQGEYSPSYTVNTGMRQELMDGKLSLVFTLTDIFKTMKREYSLNIPSLAQNVINKRDSRVFYFGFTYRFGTQPKKSNEEQLHYDEGM